MTWVCNNTNGNLFLITLMHMFYNFGWNMMSAIGQVPIEKTLFWQAVVLTGYVAVVMNILISL